MPELYAELKEDHKDILEIKEYYAASSSSASGGGSGGGGVISEYTAIEGLLHKLALRVCHEDRLGFQNTIYFLETMMAPQAPTEAAEALQDDYDFLCAFLTNLGYEEEIQSFLTLDWYVRTLGVLYLNTLSTSHGTALYDIFSMLNHSCEPNVTIEFQGMIASLKARDDLREGEELLVDYTALREEYQQHRHRSALGTPPSVIQQQGKSQSQSQEQEGSESERKQSFIRELYGFDCRDHCSCASRRGTETAQLEGGPRNV
jgi:hypothetical protein